MTSIRVESVIKELHASLIDMGLAINVGEVGISVALAITVGIVCELLLKNVIEATEEGTLPFNVTGDPEHVPFAKDVIETGRDPQQKGSVIVVD